MSKTASSLNPLPPLPKIEAEGEAVESSKAPVFGTATDGKVLGADSEELFAQLNIGFDYTLLCIAMNFLQLALAEMANKKDVYAKVRHHSITKWSWAK